MSGEGHIFFGQKKKNIRIILYFLKEKTSGAEVARMRQSKEP
jgi:hypothetical protein